MSDRRYDISDFSTWVNAKYSQYMELQKQQRQNIQNMFELLYKHLSYNIENYNNLVN